MTKTLLADVDVLVVGSGAAGMLAAVRAHDLGLSVLVIEKSDRYGGTAAVSGGGVWVPLNKDIDDDVAAALSYLKAAVGAEADEVRLAQYIEDAPAMIRYLAEKRVVPMEPIPGFPDYYSGLSGAAWERTMVPKAMDGALLGDAFFDIRDSFSYLKLLGRLSINNVEAGILGNKVKGWQRLMAALLARYWFDFGWRRRTSRDRRLCNGQALVGWLRKAMMDRSIPLHLHTALESLEDAEGRIGGAVVVRNGTRFRIAARRGVVLASGGFESNQAMRETYLGGIGSHRTSATPRNLNMGDGIRAGEAVGARLAAMDGLWRVPVRQMVVSGESNVDYAHPLFFDRGAPGSICVNRNGHRFVNEAVSYDEFCAAMIADQQASDANTPCWIIFDATCRKRSLIGPMLPGELRPDRKLPPEWEGNVFLKAASLDELARKIDVDASALAVTVAAFNADARLGIDKAFDRGSGAYDRFWADPRIKPCGSLAPLAKGPFYAMRLDVGDLGTNGGLAVDRDGRVEQADGKPIQGLYAAGNCTASIFGKAYPGAGGTLGPAMTTAFRAAGHLGAAGKGI